MAKFGSCHPPSSPSPSSSTLPAIASDDPETDDTPGVIEVFPEINNIPGVAEVFTEIDATPGVTEVFTEIDDTPGVAEVFPEIDDTPRVAEVLPEPLVAHTRTTAVSPGLFSALACNAVPGSTLRTFFDDFFYTLGMVASQDDEDAVALAMRAVIDADMLPRGLGWYYLSQDPAEEIAIYDAISAGYS